MKAFTHLIFLTQHIYRSPLSYASWTQVNIKLLLICNFYFSNQAVVARLESDVGSRLYSGLRCLPLYIPLWSFSLHFSFNILHSPPKCTFLDFCDCIHLKSFFFCSNHIITKLKIKTMFKLNMESELNFKSKEDRRKDSKVKD